MSRVNYLCCTTCLSFCSSRFLESIEVFFFFFFFPLQLLCRTHTKRGSADTKRIFCVHMYTAGSTKLSQYCLRHTCTRGAHTRIDACRLPALWCLCSLRNLSMHRLFNHFITKVTYSVIIAAHTHTHTQVPGPRCSDRFCHFNEWLHHEGKWSYQHSGGMAEGRL